MRHCRILQRKLPYAFKEYKMGYCSVMAGRNLTCRHYCFGSFLNNRQNGRSEGRGLVTGPFPLWPGVKCESGDSVGGFQHHLLPSISMAPFSKKPPSVLWTLPKPSCPQRPRIRNRATIMVCVPERRNSKHSDCLITLGHSAQGKSEFELENSKTYSSCFFQKM